MAAQFPKFFVTPAVSLDTAVFLLSKKELLQCLTKAKSVFCMFSRANIRRKGSSTTPSRLRSPLSAATLKPCALAWFTDSGICRGCHAYQGQPLPLEAEFRSAGSSLWTNRLNENRAGSPAEIQNQLRNRTSISSKKRYAEPVQTLFLDRFEGRSICLTKNKCAPLASSGAHFSQFSAFFGL